MNQLTLYELNNDKIYYCKKCSVYYYCIAFYKDMKNYCYKCGEILSKVRLELIPEKSKKEKEQ